MEKENKKLTCQFYVHLCMVFIIMVIIGFTIALYKQNENNLTAIIYTSTRTHIWTGFVKYLIIDVYFIRPP